MVIPVLTGSTCGEACWHAREEICRCSCGGKNHGCLLNGKETPKRTARIDGEIFELAAIGDGVEVEAQRINKEAGIKYAYAHTARQHYGYKPKAVVRNANKSQTKWRELEAENKRFSELPRYEQARIGGIRLLWILMEG